MQTITFKLPRGFRLQSASDFYAQFVPGSGMAAASTDGLTLAFRLDDTFEAVAAHIEESGETLRVTVAGSDDLPRARAQIGRILGLEADAEAWAELGQRSSVVARLQSEFPGFFTAAKPSPYDAAAWAVLAPRMPMRRAAALKIALSYAHGDAVRIGEAEHFVFPAPHVLAELPTFPGVPAEKMERLRQVARAALDGKLGAERLRRMPANAALRELQELRGVGPWAASHIYYRGAAPIDALPEVEPRVLHGLADVLGVSSVSPRHFIEHAQAWRPFRMWVSVLLSRHLARTDGWHAPGLARERAQAGRELARRTRAAQGWSVTRNDASSGKSRDEVPTYSR